MTDDLNAIERTLAGDVEAFRELVVRHQPRVFAFLRNLMNHLHDAEDLTQDVFVSAFRNLGSFDVRRSQFSTWLLTIARNRCWNHLQRTTCAAAAELDVESPVPPPMQSLLDGELHQRLDEALRQLPLEQRTAFVLAEIQELGHAEIAVIENVEVGTIKSRVSRAKQRLREVLREYGPLRR